MKTINVNGQILEILSEGTKREHCTSYTIRKGKGKKIGKLFIRENVHTYLIGQESVNFESYVVVA